jgi:hypothetical protein
MLFKSCREAVELAGIDLLFCFFFNLWQLLPWLMGLATKREIIERL